MTIERRSTALLSLLFAALPVTLYICSCSWCPEVFAQDREVSKFRSRSQQVSENRKIEQAFPELVRALRTLHLSPDKVTEAVTKLRRSEAATRAARQELQALEVESERQSYKRQSTKTARAEELRSSLQQSKDQLHTEIKTLLNQNQREQFERHLQKRARHKAWLRSLTDRSFAPSLRDTFPLELQSWKRRYQSHGDRRV